MRYGSLFAGIGGIDLGLERAGMECAWQVENDPYCIKVLEKHWPNTRRYEDVRSVTNPEPVDLLAGGFPCQPHSVAGKRRGAEDDRNLWPEYLRLIKETRPRYIIAENVLGIVSTYIDTVLSDLESEAYTCWTFNLPACAFDAPHRRERIFIVANSTGVEYTFKKKSRQWRVPQKLNRSSLRTKQYINSKLWNAEPNVGRMAHGVPKRIHRLGGLGNAVVPQVAEWIGERIMEHHQMEML